jgi:hypothetical protein
MSLTQQQALSYGLELRRFMKSDAFIAAVSLQRETYQRRFFESDHGETSKREQAYRMNTALDDLLNSIAAFTTHAEAEMAEAQHE